MVKRILSHILPSVCLMVWQHEKWKSTKFPMEPEFVTFNIVILGHQYFYTAGWVWLQLQHQGCLLIIKISIQLWS